MFCRQTFEVWQPLKQTVVSKVKLFTCFWSARSAHLLFFSIFSIISRSEIAHLLSRIILWSFTTPEILLNVLRWIICWSKTNKVDKQLPALHVTIRLTRPQTSTVWRQNMSCFHPIRTCFFVTCTRLDATNGTCDKNQTISKSYGAYLPGTNWLWSTATKGVTVLKGI